MELTGIFIYPIKAMGAIPLKSAILEERGLQLDRRWMLIDEQSRFICQRQISSLSLFKLEILPEHIKVSWNDSQILIPFDEKDYPKKDTVVVWDDKVQDVLIASENINSWFSEQFGITCRLAYQGLEGIRKTPTKYAPSQEVSFADGYPYLMISEETLQLLNQKLESPVEMNRFRANFIFKGRNAHIEDEYNFVKIGEVDLQCVKPCARCTVVTIDQNNGEQSKEPLATLTTYRKDGKKVLFGQCLILKEVKRGEVSIGDSIVFSDKKIQDN